MVVFDERQSTTVSLKDLSKENYKNFVPILLINKIHPLVIQSLQIDMTDL